MAIILMPWWHSQYSPFAICLFICRVGDFMFFSFWCFQPYVYAIGFTLRPAVYTCTSSKYAVLAIEELRECLVAFPAVTYMSCLSYCLFFFSVTQNEHDFSITHNRTILHAIIKIYTGLLVIKVIFSLKWQHFFAFSKY